MDHERKAIWDALRPRMEALPLVQFLGVEMGVRLAAGGLRTLWDLDQWILAYREMDLTRLCGLSPRERCKVIRALCEWCQREYLAELMGRR